MTLCNFVMTFLISKPQLWQIRQSASKNNHIINVADLDKKSNDSFS